MPSLTFDKPLLIVLVPSCTWVNAVVKEDVKVPKLEDRELIVV